MISENFEGSHRAPCPSDEEMPSSPESTDANIRQQGIGNVVNHIHVHTSPPSPEPARLLYWLAVLIVLLLALAPHLPPSVSTALSDALRQIVTHPN